MATEKSLQQFEALVLNFAQSCVSAGLVSKDNALWKPLQQGLYELAGVHMLPLWDDLDTRVEAGEELNPLEEFVYDNEADPNGDVWREQLSDLIVYVKKAGTADLQIPWNSIANGIFEGESRNPLESFIYLNESAEDTSTWRRQLSALVRHVLS